LGRLAPLIGGLTGGSDVTPGFVKKNPGLAVPGMILGGLFAKDVVIDPVNDARKSDDPLEVLKAELDDIRDRKMAGQLRAARSEDTLTSMSVSLQRLAGMDPKLYTEVMYGMRLPEGAVVLGGQPRRDLLEELALAMAEGKFTPPVPAGAQLQQAMMPAGTTPGAM